MNSYRISRFQYHPGNQKMLKVKNFKKEKRLTSDDFGHFLKFWKIIWKSKTEMIQN